MTRRTTPSGDRPGAAGQARGPAAEASMADLGRGEQLGAVRAGDAAATEVVGARRPLDVLTSLALGPSTGPATVGEGRPRTGQRIVPAFDDHHPPPAEVVADCVHCGFCLPSCPTYVLWGEEMDSPRGRIDLLKQGLEGAPLDDTVVRHLDQCLGCMACVTACPSGVRYDRLIEAARQQIDRRYERPRAERFVRRAVFTLFPYPRRLRALRPPLRLYQRSGVAGLLRRSGLLDRLPATVGAMAELAPELGPRQRLPYRTPAAGPRRATVGLLLGCVQREFFPGVNAATVRVLAAEGCDVVVPPGQGCCGALSLHAGREGEAQAFARRLVEEFERAAVDAVVVNVAGCGSAMKEYADLLADDPAYAARARALAGRVRDVTEFLAALGPAAERHPLPVTVAYHDACHLSHAQGVREQPRALLRAVPGLTLHEITEAEICCGSAGIYNLVQPQPARELGDRKAGNVVATGADLLVTGNPGCLLQIGAGVARGGASVALAHTVEVLDASIRGAPPAELLGRPRAAAPRRRWARRRPPSGGE